MARSSSGAGTARVSRRCSRTAITSCRWQCCQTGGWPAAATTAGSVVLTHGASVTSLAVLRDGRLASGGEDGRIKLWPANGTGDPVVLTHGAPVESLAVFRDGRLASGARDGRIKLWLVEEEDIIAALCLRAGRNLTKDEWARYIGSEAPWQPSCRDRPSNWRTPD